jgi:hypothetical protein
MQFLAPRDSVKSGLCSERNRFHLECVLFEYGCTSFRGRSPPLLLLLSVYISVLLLIFSDLFRSPKLSFLFLFIYPIDSLLVLPTLYQLNRLCSTDWMDDL